MGMIASRGESRREGRHQSISGLYPLLPPPPLLVAAPRWLSPPSSTGGSPSLAVFPLVYWLQPLAPPPRPLGPAGGGAARSPPLLSTLQRELCVLLCPRRDACTIESAMHAQLSLRCMHN